MSRKYTMRSKEEKLVIVKAVLSRTAAQYYEKQGLVDALPDEVGTVY